MRHRIESAPSPPWTHCSTVERNSQAVSHSDVHGMVDDPCKEFGVVYLFVSPSFNFIFSAAAFISLLCFRICRTFRDHALSVN